MGSYRSAAQHLKGLKLFQVDAIAQKKGT